MFILFCVNTTRQFPYFFNFNLLNFIWFIKLIVCLHPNIIRLAKRKSYMTDAIIGCDFLFSINKVISIALGVILIFNNKRAIAFAMAPHRIILFNYYFFINLIVLTPLSVKMLIIYVP